jgi:glyoxylase-like metal-dependent hydrolase (beta-lactamase superfamily II)
MMAARVVLRVVKYSEEQRMPETLVQVTDGVWLWPHDPDPDRVQPSVGIVVGDGASLLVDAGNSPELARRIKAAMEVESLPPATTIVPTHFHWDHTWGACAWDIPMVAHELCGQSLAEEAAKPWSHDYLRAEVERTPLLGPSFRARAAAVRDFADFRVVLPERTFTTRLTLDVGGVAVELEHVGGRHSADSTVIRVPSAGVVFIGDAYYPPPYHLRSPADRPDLEPLTSLVSEDYDWYVESHDHPLRRATLAG